MCKLALLYKTTFIVLAQLVQKLQIFLKDYALFVDIL